MRIQDYLSIGYIFILIVGVLREAIYYKILGINILEYSSLTDVLLSPISYMISQPLILIPLSILFIVTLNQPKLSKYLGTKKWYRKTLKNNEQNHDSTNTVQRQLTLVAIMIGCLLIGASVGASGKIKSLINNGTLEYRDTITFMDNTRNEARIIGQNSVYIIYVLKGEKEILISPIDNVVKQIHRGS